MIRRYRLRTRRHRILPDFLIIGAQRCGTTSLFADLLQQRGILAPARKEVHYFNRNYHRPTDWYRQHFPLSIVQVGQSLVSRRAAVTGEATPEYLFNPQCPTRVKAALPDVKLIVVLRNPAYRAYSHYKFNCIRGIEELSFEAALDMEDERVALGLERMRQDAEFRSDAAMKFSYVSRGLYVDQLRAWRAQFPVSHLLVLRSEDLFGSPEGAVRAVTEFLNVRFVPATTYRHVGIFAPQSPMNPLVHQRLLARFRSPNEELYELIGRDMLWNS